MKWLENISSRYAKLRIAVVGDVFLDKYLDIDASLSETSIETGLPVHNVVRTRSVPGAAGTIVNNLQSLGVGEIQVVGFCGDDGEGFELRRALEALPGVALDHFMTTDQRSTPTYCKPMLHEQGSVPRELNRLDVKNRTSTNPELEETLVKNVFKVAREVDALVVMDQVELPETGVVTKRVREALLNAQNDDGVLVLADCRRGLNAYPSLGFKMNWTELGKLTNRALPSIDEVKREASQLAGRTGRPVFVTLAERGVVGVVRGEQPVYVPSLPVRGPIDVVGAGDAVTANLTAALAAGATAEQAMELAMAAASIVIHQLATTGAASVDQIEALMRKSEILRPDGPTDRPY